MRSALLLTFVFPAFASAEPSAADFDFFEKRIRPVLADHCYSCHSDVAKKSKGGLKLDTRAGLYAGGDSGPAIVPGHPDRSLLLKAIRYGELRMPPSGKLNDNIVRDFETWIRSGAADPRGDMFAKGPETSTKNPVGWAFQPLRKVTPPAVREKGWSRTNFDRFLLAALENQGLKPAGDADSHALLRRLAFALTGLPPTSDDIETIERDPSRATFEKIIDRHLISPAFGERWARHWMDLICFSESHGIEHDPLIPHAWRYRDYLVRAFQNDVPIDRLMREHLAGDLLNPRWNRELGINEAPIGTAFYRFVELYPTPVDVKNEEMSVLEIQIDTLGKAFQGLTIACARCHDHKFDPISAKDYHALYGVLASGRVAMLTLDDPKRLHAFDDEIRAVKKSMRPELAKLWREQVKTWPSWLPEVLKEKLPVPDPKAKEPATEKERWRRVLFAAKEKPAHPLYLLAQVADSSERVAAWPELAKRRMSERDRNEEWFESKFRPFHAIDAWHSQGGAFAKESHSGDFALAATGPSLVTGIYPAGRFSHLISERHPGAMRSPNFTVASKYISALVCGTNDSRFRLVLENFHGDELLFNTVVPKIKNAGLHWVTIPVRDRWEGRRAYLEVSPRDEMTYVGRVPDASKLINDGRSGAGLVRVVLHDDARPPDLPPAWGEETWPADANLPAIVASFSRDVETAISAWGQESAIPRQIQLLDNLVRDEILANRPPQGHRLESLQKAYRELESKIPVPQRAVGMVDEEGFDIPYFPRGNYQLAKGQVPRGYLEVLAPKPFELERRQSGRLQLAEAIVSPKNPLTARVFVNRVWQQLFGVGLVRSPDNFGALGEEPSHPELLDFLADDFMKRGWSLRRLVREILLSRAFQMSSEPSKLAIEKDPGNRWLSHASVRRLEAEAIRDAILQVSGRLDRKAGGPSVPLPPFHYKDFYVPVSGPIDGHGRRTIYLEVRRNFLSPFLLTFDQPRPLSTTGLRNQTNVPAQALALQNDPFVLEQAALLGKRLLAGNAEPAERIGRLYRLAFARPATTEEISAAEGFLKRQAATLNADWRSDMRVWGDLAYSAMNMKEFLFLR